VTCATTSTERFQVILRSSLPAFIYAGCALTASVWLCDPSAGDHPSGSARALQPLIDPAVDLTEARAPSGRLFADGFYLTENDRQWCTRHYFSGSEGDATDPRASPALREDLSGLAPAIVITAGFDPLRDEGEAYAEALRRARTRVVLDRAPELIHGFMNMTTVPAARDAALRLAGMLRASLALTK